MIPTLSSQRKCSGRSNLEDAPSFSGTVTGLIISGTIRQFHTIPINGIMWPWRVISLSPAGVDRAYIYPQSLTWWLHSSEGMMRIRIRTRCPRLPASWPIPDFLNRTITSTSKMKNILFHCHLLWMLNSLCRPTSLLNTPMIKIILRSEDHIQS